MVLDLQKILTDSMPYLIMSGLVLTFVLNMRKLRSEIRAQQKEEKEKAVNDALDKQRVTDCIDRARKDIDMAHNEIRALKETNNRIENSVQQINFELKQLIVGFNKIESLLNKNLTEVHSRLDQHINSHIEGNR